MSWWKTAKIGDKIACVDVDVDGLLSVGAVYTIADIDIPDFRTIDVEFGTRADDCCGFRLVEVAEADERSWFHCRRFRPVQTKSTETGMAILKRILNGAPVSEDA